ncbi:MAG: acyl carrier protein [Firmicutes bacterium]|nr:acyl carrier protein [Bacillota bacterium]
MSTLEKVIELMAEQLNVPAEKISAEKEIVKDLGADSLDVVEMLMNLEEEFSVTVPDEEAVNIKTVQDVVDLIENNKNKYK